MRCTLTPTDSPGKTEISDTIEIYKAKSVKKQINKHSLTWNGTYLGTFT